MGANEGMHLSTYGEHFLKLAEEEGGICKLKAYNDGTGTWTIAWGCTKGVHEGMVITEEDGQRLFASEVAPCEHAIDRLITRKLSQPLFDITVSFFYNNGWGKCPSLIAALNGRDDATIRKTWMRYVMAYDQKSGTTRPWPGLVRRRTAELQYWATYEAQSDRVAPPAVAPAVEHPAETAAKSKTLGAAMVAGVWTGFGILGDYIERAVESAMDLIGLLPHAVAEARPVWDAGEQASQWLHFNWYTIGAAFVAVNFAIIIWRHYRDKRTIANA